MRAARVTDYRRRIKERVLQWQLQLQRFAFQEIPTLGSGEIPLSLPLVVLAGPNGVGKTTILRSVWAAAAPKRATQDSPTSLKLSSGRASLTYRAHNLDQVSEVTFASGSLTGQGSFDYEVIHIDAAVETRLHQREFAGFQDVNDIINGVGSRNIDEKTLVEVNYVSRRDYREVKIYEIESDDGIIPFFEVAYGNDRYDSRTMGAGELAILFLWWTIDRAAENALLLIEEPETNLSAATQEAFSHYLLGATVDKRLSVIMTSHSPKIINSFDEEHHVFLFRQGANVRIVESTPPPVLLSMLGIEPHIDIVILVEDLAAHWFLRQILERHRPGLSRRIEISVRNGDGNIIKLLERIGSPFSAVKILGLFDGDLRGKIPNALTGISTFLPGEKPIERIFRAIVEADPSALEAVSGSQDVGPILFALQGAEQHDWYAALSDHLGLSKAQLFPMLFQLWERQPGNTENAVEMLNNIAQLIDLESEGATHAQE
ncbi:ATP-dependent nuclease [Bradyrhizobium mercantei]|uniref:ATP-dependent nuclease n=1 Tax=Bradyrhizobium mercantei TaxID=1904807 RepID=UPI001356589A|nr:AAA family ATPase [Bradyrhizobium mercantei]